MQVGLFFGSFNPIHIGHMIIANMVVQSTELDQVWFVLSPQNPFKQKSALLKEQERLHLIHRAIDDNPKLRVTDIEFRLPKPSYTIDTLTHLKEKYPQHSFSLIMGSDNIDQIKEWKNGDLILNNYKITVYKRSEKTETIHPNITYLDFPFLDISATFIRQKIKEGYSMNYFLPEKVWKYIEEYKLYK
jgi:nicotinate-nucleotide adenylyltransferase